jgi:Trk K+ transport system NAD-binding subunit
VGPSDPLIGRTWRLIDTGHEFTVLAIGREDVQILDGRTTRFIPTELLIAVWEAHELEEVK